MSSPTHDDHDSPDDNGMNHGTTPASDAELIESACAGDTTAYGVLFARHEPALRRMAECLLGRTAEDLVLFAYTHGFDVLRGGDGPSDAIRPYLLRAMMRHCADADAELSSPPGPQENQALYDLYEQTNQAYRLVARNTYPVSVTESEPAGDPDRSQDEEERAALDAAINAAVLTMYEDLADDWRLVVWHGEVEQEGPEALALLLGIRTEEAYVLRHRARNTMRQFAVSQYLASARPARCRYAVDRLDAYDRGELEPFEGERVAGHLNECPDCAMLYEQLRAIGARLPEIVARGVLGTYTEAYLQGPSKRKRGSGWAAVRLARLRTALRHRSRGQTIGAFGAASTVVLALVGGALLFQPDISLRPTPALDTNPWTPLEFPVGSSSYSEEKSGPESGNERARTSPVDPDDGTDVGPDGRLPHPGEMAGTGTDPSDERGPTESSSPGSPGRPSDPSDPSEPSDPSDPSTPPDDDPSPTTPPDDPSPTTPPDDDPSPTDPPTDDPTDQPSDPPTDGPSDPPTDDPTTPPDSPSPTASPTPSFLPA